MPQSALEATHKLARNEIALADVENPVVRKALDVWEHLRGARAMPARADMSPRALLGLLSNIAVVRVIDDGADFEFRIVGDQIRVQQGAALQGKRMGEVQEMLPGYGDLLRRIYRNAYEAGRPRVFRGGYAKPSDKQPFFHEVAIMPVGDDGAKVDHLIVVGA